MKKALLIIGLLIQSVLVHAQPVASNIWLFSLRYENNLPHIEQALKITDNNGYSNQPHFLPHGHSLYFTQEMGAGEQTQMDVFEYHIVKRQHTNLTSSATSEYSPTPLPLGNGFSVIKVDKQGKQWLWAHSTDQGMAGKIVDAEPVGYHVWTSSDTVLAFILGEPHTLQSITRSGYQHIVDEYIGASLWPIPGTDMFSYTKNPAPDSQPWTLMAYDQTSAQTTVLSTMPGSNQYMAWTHDAKALVVEGTTILSWSLAPNNGDGEERGQPESDDIAEGDENERWQAWLDISTHCPNGATRLHLGRHDRYLALVCNE
ncbi:hypothetical protein OPS25_04290 [Alteromonas ponticola]|uniref:WD40 repeat domain-containing protein n=1 Tax=Alteromonas aquimaris TaxID=2998417 RepID=A0ABT3P4M7_9ALTE|nr:hypothetical protein [Alteromonas aquimaris]MCW8107722.1 hypothetical protein [Alteromonas aquimaris]